MEYIIYDKMKRHMDDDNTTQGRRKNMNKDWTVFHLPLLYLDSPSLNSGREKLYLNTLHSEIEENTKPQGWEIMTN